MCVCVTVGGFTSHKVVCVCVCGAAFGFVHLLPWQGEKRWRYVREAGSALAMAACMRMHVVLIAGRGAFR